MRKALLIVSVAVFGLSFGGGEQADSIQTWKSGETTVTLENGALTVSGTGAMENHHTIRQIGAWRESSNPAPWRDVKNSITGVVIEYGVTYIGNYTFWDCENLTSVTIPNSVRKIGEGAFSGCLGLTSVTIPNSVTNIGKAAFNGSGLTSVTIPDSVTKIHSGTFSFCENLTSVTIPKGVWSIDAFAFFGCISLKSITLPSSVKEIEILAFQDCPALITVIVKNPVPPEIHHSAFFYVGGGNACLYVPKNSINAYRAANIGKEFGCIKGIESAPK
jgi:hypothetical protein